MFCLYGFVSYGVDMIDFARLTAIKYLGFLAFANKIIWSE